MIFLFCITLVGVAQAQEYKKSVKSGSILKIDRIVEDLHIQGYDGNELIITTHEYRKPPERADGLKSLFNTKEDNTGIGLVIIENGNEIVIEPANKQAADASYTLKVPNTMILDINYNSPMAGDVDISGFSGEISVSTLNGDIKLDQVSGPVVLYSINGDLEMIVTKLNQKTPTSIECINGDIDITMPAGTPADLELKTINGEVFTNFDIKFTGDTKEGLMHIGGNTYKGTINGGGVEMTLSSINSNIYLRKK